MTANEEGFLAFVTHLRQEHKRLSECLQRIQQQWRQLQQRPDTRIVAEVSRSLAELRAEVSRHFEEEEAGGCLEEAVIRHPSLSHDAARLEHEHTELLGQMDRLLERLRTFSGIDASLREGDAEFRGLFERLQAHEAAENRILEEGFGIEPE